MFPRLITRYGLATHLALLASLPFVLFPFMSAEKLAQVVLCLSGIAGLWLLVEPSMRAGEHLSIARRRVIRAILHDVVFWFFLFVAIVAFIRYLNSDIAFKYVDGEWLVNPPSMPSLPASVGKAGFLPFAVVVGMAVLLQGIRHGIGLTGRISFGLTASFIMGVGGLVMAGLACARAPVFMCAAKADILEGPFWGPFIGPGFGAWLIFALAFGAHAESRKWGAARIPFCLAVAGNASGLLFFSPPVVVTAFLVLALVFAVFCMVFLARSGSMGSVARNLVLAALGFAVPLFLMSALLPDEIELEARISAKDTGVVPLTEPSANIFAAKGGGFLNLDKDVVEAYKKRSAILSGVAKGIWTKHPWYGAGVGSFVLHAPFFLTRDESRAFQDKKRDWRAKMLAWQLSEGGANRKPSAFDLRPRNRDPNCALNSYWTFLAEHGMLGVALAAIALGLLLASFFGRLVSAVLFLRQQDDADIVVFASPPITWVTPFALLLVFAVAYFAPILSVTPMWLVIVVPIAIAAASFPKKPEANINLR